MRLTNLRHSSEMPWSVANHLNWSGAESRSSNASSEHRALNKIFSILRFNTSSFSSILRM